MDTLEFSQNALAIVNLKGDCSISTGPEQSAEIRHAEGLVSTINNTAIIGPNHLSGKERGLADLDLTIGLEPERPAHGAVWETASVAY